MTANVVADLRGCGNVRVVVYITYGATPQSTLCETFCRWDCGGDNDNNVGIVDMLALLAAWGQVGGPCDFDGGGVGIVDFLKLLAEWGPCF